MNWDDILDPLRNCGQVGTQRELSTMLGGSPSLVSSSKSRGRGPSVGTQAILFAHLDELSTDISTKVLTGQPLTAEERHTYQIAEHLKTETLAAIRRRAMGGVK